MDEALWQRCADPSWMVRHLIGTDEPRVQSVEAFPDCIASGRKLRLFACACYPRVRHLLPDARARAAVEAAERVADGELLAHELPLAEAAVRTPYEALEPQWRASRGAERDALLPTHEALALALVVLWPEAQKAAYYAISNASMAAAAIARPGVTTSDAKFATIQRNEERAQAGLLRCIFGNPFRPVTISPSLRTPTVASLARAAYDDRLPQGHLDPQRLAVLADALEEAGCDEDLMAHLREPGPHVRGCHAVDVVLGRQ